MDNKTMEYLSNAIDMETSILTQKQIIELYTKKVQKSKPVFQPIEIKQIPELDYKLLSFGIVASIFTGIPVLLSLSIGNTNFGFYVAMLLFFFSLSLTVYYYITKHREIKKVIEENRINADCNTGIKEKYNAALSVWETNNSKNMDYLNQTLNTSEVLLKEYYTFDTIYPKYHTLPALTSIYEYFMTGRCTELTGPHGAYNLYEDEVRKDMIISQLNLIIDNLEQIKQNQYMLYEELVKVRDEVNNMGTAMKEIERTVKEIKTISQINTYYLSVAAKNSSFQRNLKATN